MQLSASIFKAYDIRGVVPATLDAEVAEPLGGGLRQRGRAAGETAVGRWAATAACRARRWPGAWSEAWSPRAST